MTALELLAPARNTDIGIAAIDCGADAVYIAGPAFGARKDAGNPTGSLVPLCEYAHRFGVRIFVTFNISVRDDELPEMHRQMLAAQEAGADAFIIRDERIASWDDIRVPLHASTQCAIRDVGRARHFEALGCKRLILERELSLDTIRQICEAVDCEVEFFVHGALCVCYSGECRLSEYLDGRSADRGECIQACRSLYNLEDAGGKVLVRDKALLSLKDFNLLHRLEDLAEAGVCSFKVEGRLKSESYVRNVVRAYSIALDDLVARHPDRYRRASYGRVTAGFVPDLGKSFNRGYTELFLDGKRGCWSSMDAPTSIGEPIGRIARIRPAGANVELYLDSLPAGTVLCNGDGFAFVRGGEVIGFRGDVCEGRKIVCKNVRGLRPGIQLSRNVSASFEKEMDRNACRREIGVTLNIHIHGKFDIDIEAVAEDGKRAFSPFKADLEVAQNRERAEAVIREGMSRRAEQYICRVGEFRVSTPGGVLPLLSAATVNAMRRAVVSDLGYGHKGTDPHGLSLQPRQPSDRDNDPSVRSLRTEEGETSLEKPLMRCRYCIRYELGMCPVHQGAKPCGPLFLVNNGRRLALGFDCGKCEMTVLGES